MARKDPLASLYAGPIESFTTARKKLATKLAAEGEKGLAAKVRAAAKPTHAAWVLDRLPHDAPDELKALYAAGDRMRKSQHGSAAEAAKALRDATAARTKALGALERAARRILDAKGYAASHALLRTVTNVLRNASVDPAVREQLASGAIAKTDEIESNALPAFASAVKRPREHEPREHTGPVPTTRAGIAAREDAADVNEPVRARATHHARPRLTLVRGETKGTRATTRGNAADAHARAPVATRGAHAKKSRPTVDTRALRAAEQKASRAHHDLDRAVAAVHAAEEKMRAAEERARHADEAVRRLRVR
jgi:hypothetical protein